MYISEARATLQDLPSMAETRYLERCGGQLGASNKRRSHSLSIYEQSRAKSLVERMKHTFEFKLNEAKGFESYKGNIRSEYIQSSFMTLEELLVRLPESVKFDIEISESSCDILKGMAAYTKPLPAQNTRCSSKLMIGEWTPTP